MYLGNIQLDKIKCFDELQLDFMDGRNNEPRLMTVILGDNGVGKTTLLQAIAVTLGGTEITGPIPDYINWIQVGSQKGHFQANIHFGKSTKKPLGQRTYKNKCSLSKYPIHNIGFSMMPNKFNKDDLACGYGPLRHFTNHRFSEAQDSRQSRMASLFGQSDALIPIEAWLLELDRRALIEEREGQDSKYRKTFEQVAKTLLRMMPEEHLKQITDDINSVDLSTFVKTTTEQGLLWFDGLGNWVSLSQLSDGYQSIMAWTGDLVYRLSNAFPKAENLLEQEGVVLIDEVDIHLHPNWQRKILDQLRQTFPKIQFIVTTHSPLVAASAKEDELFVLKREQDKVIIEAEAAVQGWRADQILTSPLFDLDSTRTPKTEQQLARYDELLILQAQGKLDTTQTQELVNLEDTLRHILPPPGETAEQRQLHQKMQDYIAQTLKREIDK